MSTTKDIASSIHGAIDDTTTMIENIHLSIADLPFEILESVLSPDTPLKDVREVQERTIGAVYDLVRRVNGRVGEFTAEILA